MLSKNEHNGEIDYKTVTAQYSNSYAETVYIHIADAADQNQTLIANKIHPFYTNGKWIEAGSLKAGDVLLAENGSNQTVQSVVIKAEPLKAYNLTVQDFHTYFVKGKGAETDAVWVHNECDTTPPRGAYPANKNTPDGKPIYKSYDPETNSWKDIYRGSDGKWHDYDPTTYKPDIPNKPNAGSGRNSPMPVPERVIAKNGLPYQSNPKHNPGMKDYMPGEGIEPKNSLDLFEQSLPVGDGKSRYTIDSNGDIHRFMGGENGGDWHWTGSTADVRRPFKVPNTVKPKLRKLFPEHIKNKHLN